MHMHDSTEPVVWRFADFLLDMRAGALFRLSSAGHQTRIPLGSRAFAILCLLTEHRGETVSRQEIMDAAWPNVAVEVNNLSVQLSALRRVLDADRAEGSCIQTIPGRGYRLALTAERMDAVPFSARTAAGSEANLSPGPAPFAMVDGVAQLGPAPDRAPDDRSAPSRRHGWRLAWFAIAFAVPAAAIGARIWHDGSRPPSGAVISAAALTGPDASANAVPRSTATVDRPRLSLAVLPFRNLSGIPAEDYFGNGITDDLTSDLSRVPGLFVAARQSAYAYQGKTVDMRRVGEELSVRYVLEGSVRTIGAVLRVNAQLIDTETGANLWADRFDQPMQDLSVGQEEIVRRVGQILNVALHDIENARSRRERPTNPDAFDLILRARSLGMHTMGLKDRVERLVLFEQALRLDPTSVLAMAGAAEELIRRAGRYGGTSEDFERAAQFLTDAAALAPDHAAVLGTTGYLLLRQTRFAEAVAVYRRALDLNPNAHYAYNQIGLCLIPMGRAEEAVPMIETAIRREPRSGFAWDRYGGLGFALLMLGRDQEAILWTQRALAANSDLPPVVLANFNVRLAAAFARLGQHDAAQRALAEANRVWPYDTVRAHWPDGSTNPVYLAQIERWQVAMRLAGHRDHAEENADFGVPADAALRSESAGLTPTTVPGATTIRTSDLALLLTETHPLVIDTRMNFWGRSLPGAIGFGYDGTFGGSLTDRVQERLRTKMAALTGSDLSRPIVAVGFNSERFDGRNLALRLVALGYTNVRWYRGGREAWEVAGLPETETRIEAW
jgi:adenylate cyclase